MSDAGTTGEGLVDALVRSGTAGRSVAARSEATYLADIRRALARLGDLTAWRLSGGRNGGAVADVIAGERLYRVHAACHEDGTTTVEISNRPLDPDRIVVTVTQGPAQRIQEHGAGHDVEWRFDLGDDDVLEVKTLIAHRPEPWQDARADFALALARMIGWGAAT